MSGSARLIWPEALAGDEDDETEEPPEFNSPRDVWAWRVTVASNDLGELDAIRAAGCEALLAVYDEEADDEEVEWTTPDAFEEAADRLAALVRAEDESVTALVEAFLNFDEDSDTSQRREGLLEELEQAKLMARWARESGRSQIALEISY